MKYLSFEDRTVRLRRNLLVTSALALSVTAFGIEIKKVGTSGMELSNIDDAALHTFLGLVIIYLLIAFIWNVRNEYQFWKLSFQSDDLATMGGQMLNKGIMDRIHRSLTDVNSSMPASAGTAAMPNAIQTKIEDAVMAINGLIVEYGKGMDAFGGTFKWRMVLWETLFPVLIALVALLSLMGFVDLTGLGAYIRKVD